MPDSEGSGGDRTEAPTARRLQRAREEGNVPISHEVSSLAALAAGVAAAWGMSGSAAMPLIDRLRGAIEFSGRIDLSAGGVPKLLREIGMPLAMVLLPILGTVAAAMVASTLLQSGLALNAKALKFDLSRVSPARGLGRLLGPTNLVEAAKSLVKVGVFALVIWHVVVGVLGPLAEAGSWPTSLVRRRLEQLLISTSLSLLALQVVIAAIDVAWVRFHRTQQLRMSRQDLKDEMKENDGNPQVKGRLRALRRARSRQRMMQAIPSAAVVLTNPTHYAVALAYDRASKEAPKVVAKGADEVAARIREAARAHRVPIVANPPLARTLFAVPIDQEIPREQFQAVATVIAYVWRLNQRQARAIS